MLLHSQYCSVVFESTQPPAYIGVVVLGACPTHDSLCSVWTSNTASPNSHGNRGSLLHHPFLATVGACQHHSFLGLGDEGDEGKPKPIFSMSQCSVCHCHVSEWLSPPNWSSSASCLLSPHARTPESAVVVLLVLVNLIHQPGGPDSRILQHHHILHPAIDLLRIHNWKFSRKGVAAEQLTSFQNYHVGIVLVIYRRARSRILYYSYITVFWERYFT